MNTLFILLISTYTFLIVFLIVQSSCHGGNTQFWYHLLLHMPFTVLDPLIAFDMAEVLGLQYDLEQSEPFIQILLGDIYQLHLPHKFNVT